VPPRAAALAGFAVLAAVAWAGELGADAYLGLTAAASVSAALVTLRSPAWAYAATFVVWVVLVALVAGLGSPSNWGEPALRGAWSLVSGDLSSADERIGVDAVVLWISGGLLMAEALAAARGRRWWALACAATPWLVAVFLGYGGDAVWEGGAVVVLAALWLFDQREVLARRVFAAAAVGGVAVAVVAAPGDSWLTAITHASDQPGTVKFDPTQTYGALHGERNHIVIGVVIEVLAGYLGEGGIAHDDQLLAAHVDRLL